MDIAARVREFRAEACRYFFGSARSRWRQNALLRELELHHLVYIGIDPFTMQRPAPSFTLRPATEADIESVQRIYGDHVAHGLASFEEAPPSVEEMLARFRTLKGQSFPYIVAEQESQICGYSYAGPYRTRSAYRFTIEKFRLCRSRLCRPGHRTRASQRVDPRMRERPVAADDRHHRQ